MSQPEWAARQDIVKALRSGTVPAAGLEHIAVGLEPQIAAVEELLDYAASGRSAYKFIRGAYGAGKTFLSTLACSRALESGFLTTTVVVSRVETPLYKPAQVYRKACLGLSTHSRQGGALQSLLDRWLYSLEEKVLQFDGLEEEDPRFGQVVAEKVEQALTPLGERAGRMVACLRAYHSCQLEGDYASSRALLDWLSGEDKVASTVKRLAGVTGSLDNTDALVFLRGLLELIRTAGHKGLVLVLDEVETVSRLRSTERMKSLEVLRTLVDALDKNEFPGLVLLV
ncbi:MAG: BREX system ATP-binding domain-containing protein, partial [Vulcanimicrobiota bacterium]